MSRLKKAGIGLTVVGSLAVGVVGGFEGMRTRAYRDVVGIPTVCFGETRGVKMGDVYTKEQCEAMLGEALVEFETGMRKCLVAPDAIPAKTYVAALSLTYNIGTGAFCKSTVAKRLNVRDYRGACDAFMVWNRGGRPLRVIKGLTTRRAEERRICLEGLA